MQKPRQKYTLEFKKKAVELSITYYSTIRAARELSISPENIRRWKGLFENGILENKTKMTAPNRLLQIKQLRKELKQVKIERHILRKAAYILSGNKVVKFKFIKQQRDCYLLEKICKILGVSRSGYYYLE